MRLFSIAGFWGDGSPRVLIGLGATILRFSRDGAALLFSFLVVFTSAALAEDLTITGIVSHVLDGDTIEIDGFAVRLWGLHAPEWDTQAGALATAHLKAFVLDRSVQCVLTGQRSYDRWIGRCFRGEADLAADLIASGFGRDCPRYTGGFYRSLEPKKVKAMTLPGYCRASHARSLRRRGASR